MKKSNADEWFIHWREFKLYQKILQATNEKKYQIMSEEAAARLEAVIESDEVTEKLVCDLLAE